MGKNGLKIEEAEKQRRHKSAFTKLSRIAERKPDKAAFIKQALNGRMDKYWESALEAATITPKETGTVAVYPAIDESFATALREEPNAELLAQLYNRLPRETVALQETATEIARQTVKAMEDRDRVDLHPDGYLDTVNNFIARLLQKGAVDEALEHAQKAIDFARKQEPDTYDSIAPRLAQSLEHLSVAHLNQQRRADALQATDEALAIYRSLTQTNPQTYARPIAICLNNRIGMLDQLSQLDEAAAAADEAIRYFRNQKTSKKRRDERHFAGGLEPWIEDMRPDLAACLLAQSTVLNKLGQAAPSLKAAQEATDILYVLDQEYPDQFRPLLGQAYNNLAMGFGGVGRKEDALAAIEKAVAVFKELAQVRPDTFQSYLGHVLMGYSASLIQLGRLEEAVQVGHEAVQQYEKLASENAKTYQALLLQALDRQVIIFRELKREPEAQEFFQRAHEMRGLVD